MKLPLIILCVSICGGVFAAAELFELNNNSVVNGDAEDGWNGWRYAANAEIVAGGPTGAGSCFSLNPSTGTHSDIRTDKKPASGGDEFIFEYDCRTLQGAEPGTSSLALVRSFDSSDTFLGQTQFAIETTGGEWRHASHRAVIKDEATQIDVSFILGAAGDASGEFQFDQVALFREIPRLNHGIGYPEELFVVRYHSLSSAELVTMQTLQGILAQDKPEIYIDTGNTTYIDDMRDTYGIPYTRVDTFSWYMDRYKGRLDGYVLYDFNDIPSLTAATTLCGLLNAVAVDVSIETSIIDNYGLAKLEDARCKTDKWVYDNYWDELNHDAIVVHVNDPVYHRSAYRLRDWPVAIKALDWWNPSTNDSMQVYDSVNDVSPVYGWDDAAASGELGSVDLHSQYNLYQVPCDWLMNLSTYAGLASREEPCEFTQSFRDTQTPVQKETDVHYVVFMISDMDNILTLLNDNNFSANEKYYANTNRGSFEMCWGMPPSLLELAPGVTDYWYRNATAKDCFIAPASGMGYSYPSQFDTLSKHTAQVQHLMQKADLQAIAISDKIWPNDLTYKDYRTVGESYAAIDQARGMYYLDVNGDYARYAGKMLWFSGKPLITTRYTLWDGSQYEGTSRTPAQLAASLNALPADPTSPDGYSFVIIHAWSYGMDDVVETISLLDENVKVVNAEEMIERIYLNTQVAYWPFDATLEDAFENGNDATAFGCPAYTPAGEARTGAAAIDFDGVDDYVEVNTSAGSDELLTVLFWAKPGSIGSKTVIDKLGAGSDRGWAVLLDADGSVRFRIGGTSHYTDVIASSAWETDEWVHIGCTYNSGHARLYINGELKAENTNVLRGVDDANTTLCIGKGSLTQYPFFSGVMDELSIYSRPLGEKDIQLDYAEVCMSSIFSSDAGIVLEWTSSISNRPYTVNWNTNLVTGTFEPLETGIAPLRNSCTDTVHASENKCFYNVEIE